MQFVLGLKNSEMSFQVISVVKKHISYGRQLSSGLDVYLDNARVNLLVGLSECFYDFRVLFEFITLFKTLISIQDFKRFFEKDTLILYEATKTLAKLMALPTITMEEH